MNNKGEKSDFFVWILVVAGIILFVAILLPVKSSPDKNFLEVRFYDANGNLLGSTDNFPQYTTVKQGTTVLTQGASYMDLTVNVQNTGGTVLNCDLKTITPTAFNNAMIKTTRIISPSKTGAWTSSQIALAQFEGTTTTFTAFVECKYTVGTTTTTLPQKSGIISLDFFPDGTGSFNVNLDFGGLPTEYCGDGICQSGETTTSCPADCTVSSNVKFRTSDLSYVSGSAIAFTTLSCGSTLTAYGYSSGSSAFDSTCQAYVTRIGGSAAILIASVPGSTSTGTGSVSLLRDYTGNIYLCQPASSGGIILLRYLTGDGDASKVSTSVTSINPATEVAC